MEEREQVRDEGRSQRETEMWEWVAWELCLAGLAWVWAVAAGQMVGLLIPLGWRVSTSLWDWGGAGNELFF